MFAEPTDVETAYEGSLPSGSSQRVQYLLDVVESRLRLLLPSLSENIAEKEALDPPNTDLKVTARDVVVQAVLRRLPGSNQQVESQTQTAGPWSVTNRFTTDKSGTFPDEDLDLLSGLAGTASRAGGTVGTIKLGLVDWHDQ